MNTELTFSLCYNPKKEVLQNTNINYVCSDKKIHIRLRDFNSEQVVKGFERKLAYLFTFLVNYSNIASIANICDKDVVIKALSDSEDSKKILEVIKVKTYNYNIKGLDIAENYRRKDCNPFGKITPAAFPVKVDAEGKILENNLESFLKILRIDLDNYLFNDGYYIVIYEDKKIDVNKKFNNKEIRKSNKNDYVVLW